MLRFELLIATVVAWAILGPTPGLAASCKQDPNQPKCQDEGGPGSAITMAFTTQSPSAAADNILFPDVMILGSTDARDPDDQHVCPPEVDVEIDGTRGFGAPVGDCFATFELTDPNGIPLGLDLAVGSMSMQRNSTGEITFVKFVFRPRGGKPGTAHPTNQHPVALVQPSEFGFQVVVDDTLTIFDGQGAGAAEVGRIDVGTIVFTPN